MSQFTFNGRAEIKHINTRKEGPVDGRKAYLTWQNSFQPDSNEVAVISEYLMDEVEVIVASQPDLFEHDNRPQLAAVPDITDDELYVQAVQLVRQSKNPGISHLQRSLRIGYNRAARLIEQMEADQYVSSMTADGIRVVLD